MPRVRNMDGSSGYADAQRWIAPPSLPVCKPAQILDRGADRPWPFLYSYKEGGCVVNTAPHKSAYAQAEEVGVALL
jgi:hypothetical protein